ncbi:chain length determinant protein EpsF [Methylovorus glucosotrophus]|uniref:Chain length determinant protein EpsF n=1 Tax=Methylovorus glucosotrophus (strain SIP3-4) TaxID=582744 RepID=C6X6T5_METGS|nr:chain length determinant protein EpsF [Methylovorus glucosotrophus]ACT51078.1 chain length determinant protein EpsF [Methylovorus glucosotrophus SIP3-4]
MNLSQIVLILIARYKIVLFTFGVTLVTVLVISLVQSRSYQATASVVVNYKGMDPVTGMIVPGQMLQAYVPTQLDIITSQHVALKVVEELHLADNPNVKEKFEEDTGGQGDLRYWLADLLINKLTVTPGKDSSVIQITFEGSDPDFAALVANAFASAYQETNVQLKIEPSQKAANYFSTQLKTLRDELSQAQLRLSKYQRDKGYTSTDERMDVESSKLNWLSEQLIAAQGLSIDANSRSNAAKGSGLESPDVTASPIINNLKINLASAESKLAEVSQRLDKNHPLYQSALAEVNNIKSQINAESRTITGSVGTGAKIQKERVAELEREVEKQRQIIIEMNRTRDEMLVLQKDVEMAQRAIDITMNRFSQTNIEAKSNQSDVAILNTAVAPLFPSGTRTLLKLLFGAIVGFMLGVILAFISEFLDRRVRSREDISAILDVPVFALIDGIVPAKGIKALPQNMIKYLPTA